MVNLSTVINDNHLDPTTQLHVHMEPQEMQVELEKKLMEIGNKNENE